MSATPSSTTSRRKEPRGPSARRTAVTAAGAGLIIGGAAAFLVPAAFVPLIVWDVAAALFLVVTWRHIAHLDAERTAADVGREDPTRAGADLGLLVAAVVSLVAVGYVIVQAGGHSSLVAGVEVGLGVASVVASWAVVHTIYTLRYARIYYSNHEGGVDFHDDSKPRFTDFAYLAFTVGMTFQVSDSELNTSAIRATVLRHALLSYLFGTVIVALTINLVAGLSH
jgi:uncharacterized membrane protein